MLMHSWAFPSSCITCASLLSVLPQAASSSLRWHIIWIKDSITFVWIRIQVAFTSFDIFSGSFLVIHLSVIVLILYGMFKQEGDILSRLICERVCVCEVIKAATEEKVSEVSGAEWTAGLRTKSQFIPNQALKSVPIFGSLGNAAKLRSAFTFP